MLAALGVRLASDLASQYSAGPRDGGVGHPSLLRRRVVQLPQVHRAGPVGRGGEFVSLLLRTIRFVFFFSWLLVAPCAWLWGEREIRGWRDCVLHAHF